MNPRSTDCEADALTTTPSRRYLNSKVARQQCLIRVRVKLQKKKKKAQKENQFLRNDAKHLFWIIVIR